MRQSALLAFSLLVLPAAAHALGFGRVVNNTVLGQPLDMSVAVSVHATQDPPLGCIQADVLAGDIQLPPGAISVRLEGDGSTDAQQIRIVSSVRIDEPVVTVVVNVGCSSRVSRSFILFVDPPVVGGAVGDVATLPSAERLDGQSPWLPGQAPAIPAEGVSGATGVSAQAGGASESVKPRAADKSRPGTRSGLGASPDARGAMSPSEGRLSARSQRAEQERAAARAARRAKREAAKAEQARDQQAQGSKQATRRDKAPEPKAPDQKLSGDGSRLRLEAPEALVAPNPKAAVPAASVAALAASVAVASELAASQAESLEQAQRKIRELEADLQRLRTLIASAPAPVVPVKPSPALPANSKFIGQDIWAIGVTALVALLLVGLFALWRRSRGTDEESLWWATQVGPTARKAPDNEGESVVLSQAEPPLTENNPAAYSDNPGLRAPAVASPAPDSTFLPPTQAYAAPPRGEFVPSEFSSFRSANALMDGLRVISSPPTVPSFVFAAPPLPPPDLGPPLSASLPPSQGSSNLSANPESVSKDARFSPPELEPAHLDVQLPGISPIAAPGDRDPFADDRENAQLAPVQMSVDELLDLEQQVDFFLVLGQDNDAIDALMAVVGGAGCASPIPYLKLLDIYRMQGDQLAFERLGGRFARRFGVAPPNWNLDGLQPRSIEQYPAALEDLSHHWASAPRALAWLEAAIFQSGEMGKVFDLQAYDDLIFLYLVARDLASKDARSQTGMIDLDLAPDADSGESPVFARLSASATKPMDPQPDLGQDIDIDLNINP
jgi:pilus assembly protein FimV